MSEETHKGRIAESSEGLWCAWDIVLAAVVAAWGLLGPSGIGGYLCGLWNDVSLLFGVGFLFFLIGGPVVFLCLGVLVFRMASIWPEHIAGRKRLWILRLLVLVGLVAYLALPFTSLWPRDHLGFMPGFRQYVRRTADIPAIQAWLSTADPNLRDAGPIVLRMNDPTQVVWPDTVPWPPAIKRFDPTSIYFSQTADGRLTIRMTWYTPWNRWGVEVGDKSMELPANSEAIGYQALAPGAWIWYEL